MNRALPLLAFFAISNAAVAQTASVAAQTPDTVQTSDAAPDHQAGSSIRIVRLSQVRGKVQLDRNNRGYEEAFTNLPIVQGARLKTDEGVAEVEFEDNSALRLTPNTVIEFPHLRLLPSGATSSQIRVLQGMVYVSLNGNKINTYTLLSGNSTVELAPTAHVELAVNAAGNRLAVFDGTAQLVGTAGEPATVVNKKHSLLFNTSGTANNTAPEVVARIDKSDYDDWDKTSNDYHRRYSNASAFGGGAATYGISDLNYYGSFADLPGCGNVWRPYFASAAWDPFSNGTWALYQGSGYSWVSPYPWGWTPFHSGAWQQCGTSGWGWRPGGNFVTLQNSEKLPAPNRVSGISGISGRSPVQRGPAPGQPGLIPVNLRPVAVSGHADPQTFIFNRDSAGLGVPRQTFGKLGGVSKDVAQHGAFATTVTPSTGIANSLSQRQSITFDRHENATALLGTAEPQRTGPQHAASGNTAAPNTAAPNTATQHHAPNATVSSSGTSRASAAPVSSHASMPSSSSSSRSSSPSVSAPSAASHR